MRTRSSIANKASYWYWTYPSKFQWAIASGIFLEVTLQIHFWWLIFQRGMIEMIETNKHYVSLTSQENKLLAVSKFCNYATLLLWPSLTSASSKLAYLLVWKLSECRRIWIGCKIKKVLSIKGILGNIPRYLGYSETNYQIFQMNKSSLVSLRWEPYMLWLVGVTLSYSSGTCIR